MCLYHIWEKIKDQFWGKDTHLTYSKHLTGSSGGSKGGPNRPRPPLFSADFCFFGRFLLFSGATSRNLDSRPPPPLFTDPGSASGIYWWPSPLPPLIVGFLVRHCISHNWHYSGHNFKVTYEGFVQLEVFWCCNDFSLEIAADLDMLFINLVLCICISPFM